MGVHNLWKHGEHAVKRNIRSITVHPEFKRETFENDIALFQLDPAVRYSDYIQPICLPAHLYPYIDNETECFISGWGRTAEKGKSLLVLLIKVQATELIIGFQSLRLTERTEFVQVIVSHAMSINPSATEYLLSVFFPFEAD